MTYVLVAPEMMTSAATNLAAIGSDLSEAHMAAAASTVGLVPAAADEVSLSIAHLCSMYAEDFQGLAGRAAVFHEQFLGSLLSGAASYAHTEIESLIGLLLQDLWYNALVPFGNAVLLPALFDLLELNIKIYQFWHGPGSQPAWLRWIIWELQQAFKNIPPEGF